MGQNGVAMTIKKSRYLGHNSEYCLRVTTFVRRGQVMLTAYVLDWSNSTSKITAKFIVSGVSPEAMKILRRGSDAEAMEAVFRRLPWFTHPRVRQAVTEIIKDDFPVLRAEHEARMETSRRRRLEGIQASREDGRVMGILRHYVKMITGPAVPRGIDPSEV
jgi:hypothetical protein